MAKTPTEIKSLARVHSVKALQVLSGIMNEPDAPHAARVQAANSLLDRGWGKATQPIAGDSENPLRVIQQIENVIVDPKKANG